MNWIKSIPLNYIFTLDKTYIKSNSSEIKNITKMFLNKTKFESFFEYLVNCSCLNNSVHACTEKNITTLFIACFSQHNMLEIIIKAQAHISVK